MLKLHHRRLWLLAAATTSLLLVFGLVYNQTSSAGFDPLYYDLRSLLSHQSKLAQNPDPQTNGFTQLLPPSASKTRLRLPFTIAEYNSAVGGVSGFGIHAGGHPEGLDHEWIGLPGSAPVRSWADGLVTRIGVLGSTNNEPTTCEVIINYGGGLVGQHNELNQVVVKKGQKVHAGDIIGMAHNPDGTTNAEFELSDLGRTHNANGDGATVSPYDYLTQSDKLALVAAYKTKLTTVYPANTNGPNGTQFFDLAQPYLTNDLFSRYDSAGPLSGVWYSTKPWGQGDPLDIIAIQQTANPYLTGNYVYATDFAGNYKNTLDTTFSIDGNRLHFLAGRSNPEFYALYKIETRKDGRRTLTLELSKSSYPTQFGPQAVVYLERSALSVQDEGKKMGVYQPK